MFVVERVARGHRYLYLVESVRDGKTVRQRTIKALGRKDALVASGELDRLAASIGPSALQWTAPPAAVYYASSDGRFRQGHHFRRKKPP